MSQFEAVCRRIRIEATDVFAILEQQSVVQWEWKRSHSNSWTVSTESHNLLALQLP